MIKNTKMKKAFTLVELLIVIIIIGILMAALLPKLIWAQAGARDTARKIDVSKLNTALLMYFNNKGEYPDWTCTKALTWELASYIKEIPHDPQWVRSTYWTKDRWCTGWSYAYTAITANWSEKGWSVVLSNIETYGKNSNWVLSWSNYKTNPQFKQTSEENTILSNKCESVEKTGTVATACTASNKQWATSDQNQMVFTVFN